MIPNPPLVQAPEGGRPGWVRRFLTSWRAPAALGLLLLFFLAVWARPVWVERTVTDPVSGESRVVAAWDTSRWQAVSAHAWQAVPLGLAFLGIVSAAWYGRGWIAARAAGARFFAASLLVHCLLLVSLGTVPLARAVVEQAEIIRVAQAAELFDDAPALPGGRAERPAYEKVADPKAENVATPLLARQPAAPVQPPDAADALVAAVPLHAVRGLPPERVRFVPPRQPEPVRRGLDIPRATSPGLLNPADVPLEKPEPPPPEALPREKPLEGRPVRLGRLEPDLPTARGTETLGLPELKRPERADLRPPAADLPRLGEAERPPSELTGRRPAARLALAVPPEPEAKLKAEAAPAERPPASLAGGLPRLAAPHLPGRIPDESAGTPALPDRPARTSVPAPRSLDVVPALGPADVHLARVPAAGSPAAIEEVQPARVPLVLREKEERERSVAQFGGTRESEAAVERGLDWLAAHQNANGSWSLHNHHANCRHPKCGHPGTVASDPAGTGMALLPFLAAGHTSHEGKHRLTVTRALHWLLTHQLPEGNWPAPGDARPMYGHAMATIALCEAYGMTQSAKLRGPAQKAADYIVRAQHAATGGWRYTPNQPADTSVVGWQMMALKSAEMAGLPVPARTFDGIKRWLASVEANRPTGGLFGYQSPNPTPAMTAQGLLCLQYLGAGRDDPRMKAGTDYLLRNLPRPGAETSYYWYHATQVMYHVQGKHWKAWNEKLRDQLVSSQETKGALAGSWKPVDHREKPGGRVYATALRLLMLEVYYRHLPLYQQLER